jgi:hypothetical protein
MGGGRSPCLQSPRRKHRFFPSGGIICDHGGQVKKYQGVSLQEHDTIPFSFIADNGISPWLGVPNSW